MRIILPCICLLFALSLNAWAQQPPSETQTGNGKINTLNLNNADIRVLINMVAELTGENFIIDPRVKSKVTVVSNKPMSRDEIYEVFLSVLQVHGYAAVPGVGVTKIVPEVNAKQGPVKTINREPTAGDELVTSVIKIEHVEANQMVPILRMLVPQQGQLAAYAPSNVLIITDRAANIERLREIIRRIDRADSDEVEVIPLEHASASEINRVITSLIQQGQKSGPTPGQASLMADERTNSILLTGDKASRLRIRGIIAQLDTPLESGGNTKVIFLNYASAKDMVGILQGVSSKTAANQQQQQGGERRSGNEIDIQADEANNAIVITAPPSVIRELEAIIRQLDVPRAQVMIEAIIAEISLDITRELGSQLLFNGAGDGDNDGDRSGNSLVGGSLFGGSANLIDLLVSASQAREGNATTTPNLGEGLSLIGGDFDGDNRFALLFKALSGNAATNILSTPSITTLDNVEAELVVAQNVPFVTGTFTGTGTGQGVTNPFQTVQRQDVGITLKVKPHINEGDRVKLEIQQEVSSVEANSVSNTDITTNKRTIKTEIMADDGQIIVLGGLIQDRFLDTKSKVPLLGSIPILGRLFSYNKTTKVKTNLMIFIRPVILRDNLTTDYVTQHKYKIIQARQLDAKIGKRGLIRDSAAKLPDIEVLFTPMPEKAPQQSNPDEAETQQ